MTTAKHQQRYVRPEERRMAAFRFLFYGAELTHFALLACHSSIAIVNNDTQSSIYTAARLSQAAGGPFYTIAAILLSVFAFQAEQPKHTLACCAPQNYFRATLSLSLISYATSTAGSASQLLSNAGSNEISQATSLWIYGGMNLSMITSIISSSIMLSNQNSIYAPTDSELYAAKLTMLPIIPALVFSLIKMLDHKNQHTTWSSLAAAATLIGYAGAHISWLCRQSGCLSKTKPEAPTNSAANECKV